MSFKWLRGLDSSTPTPYRPALSPSLSCPAARAAAHCHSCRHIRPLTPSRFPFCTIAPYSPRHCAWQPAQPCPTARTAHATMPPTCAVAPYCLAFAPSRPWASLASCARSVALARLAAPHPRVLHAARTKCAMPPHTMRSTTTCSYVPFRMRLRALCRLCTPALPPYIVAHCGIVHVSCPCVREPYGPALLHFAVLCSRFATLCLRPTASHHRAWPPSCLQFSAIDEPTVCLGFAITVAPSLRGGFPHLMMSPDPAYFCWPSMLRTNDLSHHNWPGLHPAG